MTTALLMPALSPTMTEGTLSKWLIKEGDSVSPGDILAEVETDKATMEVESIDEGILAKILVNEGTENVPVNTLIGVLVDDEKDKVNIDAFINKHNGDKGNQLSKDNDTELKPLKSNKNLEQAPNNDLVESSDSFDSDEKNNISYKEKTAESIKKEKNENDKKVLASPLAKRLANIANIDLRDIEGSGPKGRIIKKDLDKTIDAINSKVDSSAKTFSDYRPEPLSSNKVNEDRVVALSSMRKTIAKRLVESKQNIPHFYLKMEIEIDKMMDARKEINNYILENSNTNDKITVNDFLIKATALALKNTPEANCSLNDDEIIFFHNVDISVAVAVENGLFTPIIKNASDKSLLSISKEMKLLIEKAKNGKLNPQEYIGGNFSISNLGMHDIDDFTAIINPPQSGIIAFGKAVKKPVIKNNEIVVVNTMTCNLSADHRAVDGATGAKLLRHLKNFLSNPNNMLI